MKTIGLLAGMSWESSTEYYRLINEGVRNRLGSLNSAEIIMASVDFGPISTAMNHGDWKFIEDVLVERTGVLAAAGAELLLICTNTMHKLADPIRLAAPGVPLIHIGECAAAYARKAGYARVALLGTRFTMEEDFYLGKLEDEGLSVLIPDAGQRNWINKLIFEELCSGVFTQEARAQIAEIIRNLADDGAEAVVLGCTELPLIISREESALPLIDTMMVHAQAAVEAALAEVTL